MLLSRFFGQNVISGYFGSKKVDFGHFLAIFS